MEGFDSLSAMSTGCKEVTCPSSHKLFTLFKYIIQPSPSLFYKLHPLTVKSLLRVCMRILYNSPPFPSNIVPLKNSRNKDYSIQIRNWERHTLEWSTTGCRFVNKFFQTWKVHNKWTVLLPKLILIASLIVASPPVYMGFGSL